MEFILMTGDDAAALKRKTLTHLKATEAFLRHMPGGIRHVSHELLWKLEKRTIVLRDALQHRKYAEPAGHLDDILAVWTLSDLSSHTYPTEIPDGWHLEKTLESIESLFLGMALFRKECERHGYNISEGPDWKSYTHWFSGKSAELCREETAKLLTEFRQKKGNAESLTAKQLDMIRQVLSKTLAEKISGFSAWDWNDYVKLEREKKSKPIESKPVEPPSDSVFGTHDASSLDDIPF